MLSQNAGKLNIIMIDNKYIVQQIKKVLAQAGLIVYDGATIFLAAFFSLLVRYEQLPIRDIFRFTLQYAPFFGVLFIGLYHFSRLYQSLWRFSGLTEASKIIYCVLIALTVSLITNELAFLGVSRAVIVLTCMLSGAFGTVPRFGYRVYRQLKIRKKILAGDVPLLIVGAGYTGAYVITQMQAGIFTGNYSSAILVDDDTSKLGKQLHDVPIVGSTRDIPFTVKKYGVTDILIAIPSLHGDQFTRIFEVCNATGCRVRMVPLLEDVKEKKLAPIREVNINDILFRDEVQLDKESITNCFSQKRVLITGGGGSIGSELCRQAVRFGAKGITIFDNYENNAYELLCEMKDSCDNNMEINVAIGSIRDKKRLESVFSQYRPEIVLHAAAHKHVPLMEESPGEAIKNNVIGTLNVLEAASAFCAERFVLISTDKAVNPTNIMGATKRIAEMMVQSFSRKTHMKCMTVRFGNVLGSHGSVIPLMERQIRNGGPVKVTHPNITRYFMTIPEASQLVLQAATLAESGAIYVLDMNNPIRIMDLAEKLIKLHGYEPNVNMPIVITGLRKGEKLFEELTMTEEKSTLMGTDHARIFKVSAADIDFDGLDRQIAQLMRVSQNNDYAAVGMIKKIVPNYQPQSNSYLTDAVNEMMFKQMNPTV